MKNTNVKTAVKTKNTKVKTTVEAYVFTIPYATRFPTVRKVAYVRERDSCYELIIKESNWPAEDIIVWEEIPLFQTINGISVVSVVEESWLRKFGGGSNYLDSYFDSMNEFKMKGIFSINGAAVSRSTIEEIEESNLKHK